MTVKPAIFIDRILKDCVCFVGTRQTGKTNGLTAMLNSIDVPYRAFDILGVLRDARAKGWQPVNPATQHIITPSPHPEIIRATFSRVCDEVWQKGNMILAIDELSARQETYGQKTGDVRSVPYFCDKYWMHPKLWKLVNQGGNRNIAVWFTTQRVAQVHNDLLSACKYHFIFPLYLPPDIEWYGKVVTKAVAENAQNLPPYHFLFKVIGGKCQIMKPFPKMY